MSLQDLQVQLDGLLNVFVYIHSGKITIFGSLKKNGHSYGVHFSNSFNTADVTFDAEEVKRIENVDHIHL